MKIVDVKAIYPKYKHVQTSWRTNFWQIVVRIQTDSGDVGYGYGGGGIAGVDIINRHFKNIKKFRKEIIINQIIRDLINVMVNDVIKTTNKNLKKYNPKSINDIYNILTRTHYDDAEKIIFDSCASADGSGR